MSRKSAVTTRVQALTWAWVLASLECASAEAQGCWRLSKGLPPAFLPFLWLCVPWGGLGVPSLMLWVTPGRESATA